MPFEFWLLVICLIVFIIIWGGVLYIKWKARASKSFFALAIVSAILSCFSVTIAAVNVNIIIVLMNEVLRLVGISYELPTSSLATNFLIIVLCAFVVYRILFFASDVIKNWNAPLRISEVSLARQLQDEQLFPLAKNGVVQLYNALRHRKDGIATNYESSWKTEPPAAPEAIDKAVLLKELFCMNYKEVEITESGYRSRGNLWIGQMYENTGLQTFPIILLIFSEKPDLKNLSEKLDGLDSYDEVQKKKLFAVYESTFLDDTQSYEVNIDGKTIECIGSRALLIETNRFQYYARELIKSFNSNKIGATDTTLASSYVEINVSRSSNCEPIPLASVLSEWEAEDSQRHLAITGEYGQGKSSAMLKFCADWASAYLEGKAKDKRVPLLIELRGRDPANMDPKTFISTWCHRYDLEADRVYNLVRAGEAILIFEGFDELQNAGREYDRYRHFKALWSFAFPNAKLIFTGRPNFFLGSKETNLTLRSMEFHHAEGSAFSELLEIVSLTIEQIRDACRPYDSKIQNGIVKLAERDANFYKIVSRPSMLPVVATIWDKVESLNESPAVTDLFDLYIDAIYERKIQEERKDQMRLGKPTDASYLKLPKEARHLLTTRLAFFMAQKTLENTISQKQLSEFAGPAYSELLELSSSHEVSHSVRDGLERFEVQNKNSTPADKLEIICSEIRSPGLLIPDPGAGEGNLKFAHKQFFEFFVAKAVLLRAGNPNETRKRSCSKIADYCTIGVSGEKLAEILSNVPVACKFYYQKNGESILPLTSNLIRKTIYYNLRFRSYELYIHGKIKNKLLKDLFQIFMSQNKHLLSGAGINIAAISFTNFIIEFLFELNNKEGLIEMSFDFFKAIMLGVFGYILFSIDLFYKKILINTAK